MSETSPSPDPSLVEAIFLAALDRDEPDSRAAYLDSACGEDAGLRLEVDRLLAMHSRAAGFLEPQSPIDAGATASIAPGAGASEAAGTLVAGRYKLLETIGEGGMGTVWAAEQTKPVRRKIALKLIKAGMDSRAVLARFEVERQALAMMDHPNIARVLDGGATDQGRPYFVMEYVKGIPITDYCDHARLTVADRLRLFLPVCRAVQHAHQKGIIHRDLKPSNVLVCLYDGEPVPKVIDFGLAKAIFQPLTEHTLYTGHGVMLGTPLYMSPEQAELNNLDVDTRTDVYALGVILYELLTGSTPLEKQRFQQAAWHEMLRLIKEEDPPRPSTRLSTGQSTLPSVAAQRRVEPLRLSRLMRGELDWIALKSLEKDRSRRYGTPTELSADVERYLQGDVVLARPPSIGYRLHKFARRHRAGLFVASAFASLLLVATALSGLMALRARQAATEANLARAEAELARDAEHEERKRAEEQFFKVQFFERRQAFLQNPDRAGFLGLVALLDKVPQHLSAWRDHLVLTVMLAVSHTREEIMGVMWKEAGDLKDIDQPELISTFSAQVFDKDRRRVAIQTCENAIEVYDLFHMKKSCSIESSSRRINKSWEQRGTLHKFADLRERLGFFKDGTKFWLHDSREVRVYESETGRARGKSLSVPMGFKIEDMAAAPGGRTVMIRSLPEGADQSIPYRLDFWELDPTRLVTTLDGPRDVERAAFNKDGSRVAISYVDRVEVLSTRDWSVVCKVSNLLNVKNLAFSPSGQMLAALTQEKLFWLDPERGTRISTPVDIREFAGFEIRVDSISWLSDALTVIPLGNEDGGRYVGVRVGSESPLQFSPHMAFKSYILSETGDVYNTDSQRRIVPPAGRKFADEARQFAIGGRWLQLPKGLIDLSLDEPVPMSENLYRRSGGVDPGWMLINFAARNYHPQEIRVWAIPERLRELDSGTLHLWAELLACAALDEEGRARALDEADWEMRRLRLGTRLRGLGVDSLPGLDVNNRLGWLRDAVQRESNLVRKVALLDRLIAAEGGFRNHLLRAEVRTALKDFAGGLDDVIAAVKSSGPETWEFLSHEGLTTRRLLEGILNRSRPANPANLALVNDYLDLRSKVGFKFVYDDRLSCCEALYRVGRFEEASRLLEPLALGKNGAFARDILLRAMVCKRLGQVGAAEDYRVAKAAMDNYPKIRDESMLQEAAKLFGP